MVVLVACLAFVAAELLMIALGKRPSWEFVTGGCVGVILHALAGQLR